MGSMSRTIRRERAREAKLMEPHPMLRMKLDELRATVDHFNQMPKLAERGGVFRALDPNAVYTTKKDGFEFGYQLVDLGAVVQRTVYVKCEQPIREVPPAEWMPVLATVFECLIDQGAEYPEMHLIDPQTLRIRQKFVTVHWVEMQPGIVTPGRA